MEAERQNGDNLTEQRWEEVNHIRGLKEDGCISVLLKAMEDVSWRVRKTAVDILLEDYPVDKYIEGLVGLLYLEDNAGARNSAIEALIKLGNRITPFLIEAFKTPNKDVRKFIIDVLGEQKDGRSLPLMLEAIKDEDENVRATAVEHLGKTREVSVVDALIEIVAEGDLWTAYPAADALGMIGNRKAVPCLTAALGRKPLREPVLKSLGRLADPSTLDHVVPLLADPSRNIQEAALRSIEKFYHNGVDAAFITAALRNILGDKAMELLIKHAWSNRNEVRISAILLLGLMKDEAAYAPLLDISHEEEFAEDVKNAFVFIGRDNPRSLLKLFDTDDAHQRRFICEVTDRINSPLFYDVLEEMLSNEDGHVRSIAAVSISKLKDGRAVEKLKLLLSDDYEDVQDSGVEALTNLKAFLDINEIIAMLKSGLPALRKNSARVLGKIGATEALAELSFALKDVDVTVRKAVVEALALIRTDDAVRYLTYALTDEVPDIRSSAALSLGRIGGAGVLDSLAILSADPDSGVRVAAAKSMGLLKDGNAVPVLISLLGDKSGFVVASALESLGAVGGDAARDAVKEMLQCADDEIKRTAITALGAFQNIGESLIPFLKDPDWAVRAAAVRSIGRQTNGNIREELERLRDTEEDGSVLRALEETLRV